METIEQVFDSTINNQAIVQGAIEYWDINRLIPHPFNPRGEIDENDQSIIDLAASIEQHGVLSPILVIPGGLVLAGHRRRIASKRAGLTQVPVIVKDLDERKQLEVMMIENLQRQDLNPLQEGLGYKRLNEQGMSNADIVRALSVPSHRVRQCLALLDLPDDVQQLFATDQLPLGAVMAIASVKEPGDQTDWALRAVRGNWSVRLLEEAIKNDQNPKPQKQKEPGIDHAHTAEDPNRPTLQVLMTSIASRKAWPVKLGVFEKALLETGCACSLIEKESLKKKVCSTCPLSHFLQALLRGIHDESQ